jgi:hypothetical protein
MYKLLMLMLRSAYAQQLFLDITGAEKRNF